ncbi:MAG: MerR family transcriptional regulator [Actinobacteria bacterium]|nr:MerR family transcriptional regulator [Actinomycetota bacterium]MBU1945313.1 MerR family transcriptional regulator [Actinomycetota bacterium]MBU2686513.1 MerR family transcriptional regulator [Actinomycetota bacterium]
MEKDQKEGLYIISVAAQLADVHPQTLRMYERRGLLLPQRTAKNRRRYSDEDIERLRHIQELTQAEGLNLSGVRMVLEMEDELANLRERVAAMQEQMNEVQRMAREQMEEVKRRVALSAKPPASIMLRRGRR